jgi:hypothetical protein
MRAKTQYAGSLLLMMVLGGCGPVALEDMKAPAVWVAAPGRFGGELLINLGEAGDDCPDLSTQARASFNDVEVPMMNAGQWVDGSFLGPSAHCAPTLFRLEKDAMAPVLGDGPTRVSITEGTKTFHAEVQALCAPRRFTVSSPADGVLRPGDEVELEWQPATDELLVETIRVVTPVFTEPVAHRGDGSLRVEGNRMRFRMPELGARVEGPAELVLNSGEEGPYRHSVTRCEGFVQCDFVCWFPELQRSIQVTLQPQ